MKDEIIQMIEDFAKNSAHDGQVTIYHLLSAFAKLLSMNQQLLNNMFNDKSSMDKLQKMYTSVEEKNIDISLMKQSFSIIVSSLSSLQKNMTFEKVFGCDMMPNDALILFNKLFKLDLPEFHLITKDKSLDDTLNFIQHHSRENKDSEQTGKKEVSKLSSSPLDTAHTDSRSSDDSRTTNDCGRSKFEKLIVQSKQLYSNLLGKIKGQDDAVKTFTEGYFQSEIFREQEEKKKPGTTFLFAGPPGVGKTFLAESAAEFLGLPFARFDMSEYGDNLSTSVFAGSEPKYNGAKPGTVTGFVAKHPKCILLFDEIEKAHLNVIYLFLQILDGGILTDNYTEKKSLF